DTAGTFDTAAWRALGATGLFALGLPVALGGRGHALRHVTAAWRGLGAGSLDLPFCTSAIAQSIGIDILARFGAATPQARLLPALVRGASIVAISNAEEGAGTDVRAARSRLELRAGGAGVAHVRKPGATNLPGAAVVLASAWCHGLHDKPSLEVIALAGDEVTQIDHRASLAGFRTGLTGGIHTAAAGCTLDAAPERIVGGPRAGFRVMKHCFNLERLYIGALVSGVLLGARQTAMRQLRTRTSMGQPLLQHQYVQGKLIQMLAAERHLQGLIDSILRVADDATGLPAATHLLALLKIAIIEAAGPALRACFDLFGFIGYTDAHFAQKLVRDHMALALLGGTAEQQRLVLFAELLQHAEKDPPAHEPQAQPARRPEQRGGLSHSGLPS
ncbi:MAG TPA: acyl-CoA dehydrogenase family protein, partial [Myxococcota bacterium]|nr:acyl-CoA dehydrogenase family protein [Myxococcota bacterium]